MEARFLNPAMSSLSVQDSSRVRSSSALATPACRSSLGLIFAGAPSTAQIQIRWKTILVDSVQRLGGTEPMYVCEETMDGMFQARVSFRLPLDISFTNFKEISVTGIKCPTLFEAESEASVVAFHELQDGCLRMCVIDVNFTRCRELEKHCYEIIDNATEIFYAAKSLLADWEEDMNKAEDCYSSGRNKVPEDMWAEMKNVNVLRPDVTNELVALTRKSYDKLLHLAGSVEEVKNLIDISLERIKYFFCEPSLNQVNVNRGCLSQEFKLCMNLVLKEMMTSIGWEWPKFNIISLGMSLYVCETSLFPNHIHVGPPPKTLTITGSETESEEEAIESSCKAAIAFLEREKSLCLVDLNFNRRSHAELYVVEARDALKSATFMIPRILSEWEAMVDEIQLCKQRCDGGTVDQPSVEETNLSNGMNYSSRKAVADLHEGCLADLRFAKHRLKSGGVWTGE